jgi:hypothetical protein
MGVWAGAGRGAENAEEVREYRDLSVGPSSRESGAVRGCIRVQKPKRRRCRRSPKRCARSQSGAPAARGGLATAAQTAPRQAKVASRPQQSKVLRGKRKSAHGGSQSPQSKKAGQDAG